MKFYVYKCFLDHTSNHNFIQWAYACKDEVGNKTAFYLFIENNKLQDPFYEQVFLPLIFEEAKKRNGDVLPITPDTREKPEKWLRIEGNLEPLNRLGLLVLNIEEKNNPHMKRLESQFKAAKATSKLMDGPDAVEGGVFLIKEKLYTHQPGAVRTFKRTTNPKRY
jgi:hypothetical protein